MNETQPNPTFRQVALAAVILGPEFASCDTIFNLKAWKHS